MEVSTQKLEFQQAIDMLSQKRQSCQWGEVELFCRQLLETNTPSEEQLMHDGDEAYRFMVCALGESLTKQQKFNEAIWLYQKSIDIDPCPDFQSYLGAIYHEQGQWDVAATHYRAALRLNPDCPEIYVSLGEVLAHQGDLEESAQAYQRAIALRPDWGLAHYLLGNVFADAGQLEDAISAHQNALEIQPDLAIARFGICMHQLPLIYKDSAEIQDRRHQYQSHLEALSQHYQSLRPKERASASESIGTLQPFYLAYQGLNDKGLQQQYGQMICQIMASCYPQWSHPLEISPLQPNEKIRVGFVSRFFYNHSNWKIPIRGWIENINKSEFELFGYYTGTVKDSDTVAAAKTFDKFYQGDLEFTDWAEQIQRDNLHILIFPEFGMDPTTVRLGCLRLAPIQATSWGHPNTSGLPTIDYYLSSDLMEPPNAQEHYSETLLKLPNLSIHYTPLNVEPIYKTRAEIGVQSDSIIYWCCQSLYKYLPQHDDVFPKIARALPSAKFVFIEHSSQHVTQVFRQRLSLAFQAFGLADEDFCIFIERMTPAEFAGVSAIVDVFLDSMGWSGCNSALESVAHDVPIVTMPGDLMRSRHTAAILERLGIQDVIASGKEDYIDIAVQLGKDHNFRHTISRQIAANKHQLYGDLSPVRALEDFFRQVTCKSQDEDSSMIAETLRQASTLHRHHQLAEAEQVYRALLEHYPNHADALLELGLLLQEKQRLAEAALLLRQATQAMPQSVKAWFALGNLHSAQENFSEAVAAFRQALVLRPDAVSIYNNLGFALQNQGDWEEAIAFYRQALVIRPTCVEAEANLGNALHAKGELHTTQIEYYANLNYELGKRQQGKGNATAALSYFRHAITLQPSFVEAELALGICLRDAENNPEKALEHFLKLQAVQPNEPTVYVEIGRTHQIQGNISDAVHAFQQYLTLTNPSYARHAAQHEAERAASPLSPDLDQFKPPLITFSEVTVGDYTFPAIPPAETTQRRPFWSVVIPAVNRPEYFPECLASVLAQWREDAEMEILVLDNGSEPPLFDIVDALGKGIIRYVRLPETIPLQENWNTMVALAQGEWIFLLQHDDYVLPGFFEQLREGLEQCPDSVGAAFTNYENIDEKRQVVFSQSYGLGDYRGIVKDWIKQIGVSNPTSPPSVIIRRTAYESVGGYKLDLPYTCDWELYMRVAAAYDWWHEPSTLAHYRQYNQSLTLQDSFNGVSGTAHRQAIEIAQTYMPPQWAKAISQNSRTFHFEWCLNRAMVAVSHGAWFGAMKLAQEALLIDPSAEADQTFWDWINSNEMQSLKTELSRQLWGGDQSEPMVWTIETIEQIRTLEL